MTSDTAEGRGRLVTWTATSAIQTHGQLLAHYLKSAADRECRSDRIDKFRALGAAIAMQGSPALEECYGRYSELLALATRDASLRARLSVPPVLPPVTADGPPGISLVTCSMNRTENLLRSLPSWIANDEIDEIVVVDWSSTEPVRAVLAAAGISEPRLRVVRVDGASRWILSYAFNAGFRVARFDTILKVDADIVLSADVLTRNALPDRNSFVAGNWRMGEAAENGFFLAPKAALARVSGFSEFITTYGWDDDDLYDRLQAEGLTRHDVAPNTIAHLPHDDEERSPGASSTGSMTALAALRLSPRFLIQRNRILSKYLPKWPAGHKPLALAVLRQDGTGMDLRPADDIGATLAGAPHPAVPQSLNDRATEEMTVEMMAWEHGPNVRDLPPEVFAAVMQRPANLLHWMDFELALAAPARSQPCTRPRLVLSTVPASGETTAQTDALAGLVLAARRAGMAPVLHCPNGPEPAQLPAPLAGLPALPRDRPLGNLRPIGIEALLEGPLHENCVIEVTPATLAAPALAPGRRRLFVDAQHGLGNRLRAIGSAAAIAAASDRELVIVWQPDPHCDCSFADLFDYTGAVIGHSFIDEAADCEVQNYMTAEGGIKNEPIRAEAKRDLYLRAAFVFVSPHSHWEADKRFLQGLTPVEAVQTLVESVRHPNSVSVHVRMEGGTRDEHLPYESASNWTAEDHALLDHWRERSHYARFMARLDALVKEGLADTVFLAADKPEAYEAFASTYGDRVAWLQRSLYDRSTAQLHFALADAILLSRAPLLLGSTWSSFSELAMRLAPQGIKVELSGRDF